MAKIRVAVIGSVGKSVLIDTDLGARVTVLEERVAALGSAAGGRHSALTGLQSGDDHPQYTMWAAAENVTAVWNFAGVPTIGGIALPEYIEDTIGGILTDSTSIDFTYNDGANTITASIINEYVQDLVGALFVDSTSVDFTYDDGANTMTAATVNANPSGLIGMAAVNGTAATPLRSDGRHAIDPAIAPTWTGQHQFRGSASRGGTSTQISMGTLAGYGILDMTSGTAGTDQKTTEFFAEAGTGDYVISTANEAASNGREIFRSVRGTGIAVAAIALGNNTDLPPVRLRGDSQEFQIGASQDLRLYHDGTNSFIENDTGNLVLKVNGELDLEEVTTSTGANVPTIGTNKPGSAVSLTPATWLTLIVNGTTYYTPLWT